MRFLGRLAASLLLVALSATAETSPRELYQQLNSVRVDPSQIYFVRELHLRRDVVRMSLTEGKLAFLTAPTGRVTGAVFSGRGRVLAVPRDPIEKRSLARFLGEPLLDQGFSRAYLRFTDGAAEELRQQLREAGAQPLNEPSFAEEWNPTVANLNPWHSLRVLADWLSADPQPYFYAGVLGEVSGPFDVLVDSRLPEQIVLGQPRWAGGVRFYDVWATFPLADAPASFPATFTPLSYTIQTTIQADRTLVGQTVLGLKAERGGERVVPLELSRFLQVQAATDGAGRPLAFFQNEEINRREIAERGNDSLFVVLPEAAHAGEVLRVRLEYRGGVISDAGNGVYFVGDRGSWYPHLGGIRFAPYDLTFRWPARFQLVATGTKVEEGQDGEWRSGRWRSEVPVPLAGFNLSEYIHAAIDAGALKIDLYVNRQLESALLERINRGAGAPVVTLPPTLWPRPRASQLPRVTLQEPPPNPAALLEQLGREIAEAIRFYEKFNGPFPYEHLAVSQIPGTLGQGWPGLLYLPTLSFLTPAAQERAGIPDRAQEQFSELVPAHEVAHQWWGNVVGWSGYRDEWIHEGLANYLALLYADSRKPGERTLASWLERYRGDLTTKPPGEDQAPTQIGPLSLGDRLRSSKSPGAYTQIVYAKGTWAFHMLRSMLRDPAAKNPDARFIALLRSLLEGYRGRALTTADLQHAIENVMTPAMDLEGGRTMDWFFDQWVRGTGIPRYAVEFEVRSQGNGFLVRGKLKQKGVPETFLASVPVYASRASGKPVLLGNIATTGPETPFQFVTRFRPKRILIDPQLTLLCLNE